MAEVEILLDAHATIGEAPTWSAAEAALYWIDVKAPALHRYHPMSGEARHWPVTSDIGAFALMPQLAGALVALRTGIFHLHFATGALAPVASAPFDPAMFRFNDGGCDPEGRFWVGVMFDPACPDSPPQPGTLHSFTPGDGLRPQADMADLHNGLAWSADGKRMFVTHSNQKEIHCIDVADGRLGERRLFARIPDGHGTPDGAAIDAEGGYWCALHGGGRLRRFFADGAFDRDVLLPVSQPTMCAFGGAELEDLYVTSAADQLTAEQLLHEPHAGALLRLRPGERGVPRRCTVQSATAGLG